MPEELSSDCHPKLEYTVPNEINTTAQILPLTYKDQISSDPIYEHLKIDFRPTDGELGLDQINDMHSKNEVYFQDG